MHIAERDTQVSNKPEAAGRVRQHLVGGRLRERGLPAGRDGLGHARAQLPARRQAPRLRLPGRDLPDAAGRGHARAHLDAEARAISTASASPTARRSRSPITSRCARARRSPTGPTVHYAYHPCDSAVMSVHELAGRNYVQQERQRILMDEITSGIDELGVLLAGHKKNAYWYGSQLSIEEARKLAPYNNATSLQVCVAVLAGVDLGDGEPELGVVEPDEMDFRAQPRDLHALSWARWSGSTPTGRRCTSASGCSPRTSTRAIPGSSRTCGSSGSERASGSALCGTRSRRSRGARTPPGVSTRHLIVQRAAQQRPPERGIHADVAGRQVELVRTDDAVALRAAVRRLRAPPRRRRTPAADRPGAASTITMPSRRLRRKRTRRSISRRRRLP